MTIDTEYQIRELQERRQSWQNQKSGYRYAVTADMQDIINDALKDARGD